MPHIHAKYQGEEISIGILTGEVKGEFKNKKKQREAIGYVEANKQELLELYNQKTNGIHSLKFVTPVSFLADGNILQFEAGNILIFGIWTAGSIVALIAAKRNWASVNH